MKNTIFHLVQITVVAIVVISGLALLAVSPVHRDVEILPFVSTGGTAEVIGQIDIRPSLIFKSLFPFPEAASFVNLTELWNCSHYKIGYDDLRIFVQGGNKKENSRIAVEQIVMPSDYWFRLQAINKISASADPDHITVFVQYGKAWFPVIIYIAGLIVLAGMIILLSKKIIFRQKKEYVPVIA
ncbi:MAG: hypothetical protein ABSE68_02700 [Minisyncoccia bacterium]